MKSNGVILYRGPSSVDGAEIVAVATGLVRGSANTKTGNAIQTWILRADRDPVEAARLGLDAAVCGGNAAGGGCRHRPVNGRSCYVVLHRAPLTVFRAVERGNYPEPGTRAHARALVEFTGRIVRLGSYGDPAAVPFPVVSQALRTARGWLGYTHLWRACDPRFRDLCMASVDTPEEAVEARAAGWRTFRVRPSLDVPLLARERMCPASAEAGKRTDCATCAGCAGAGSRRTRDTAIVVHGDANRVRAFRARV